MIMSLTKRTEMQSLSSPVVDLLVLQGSQRTKTAIISVGSISIAAAVVMFVFIVLDAVSASKPVGFSNPSWFRRARALYSAIDPVSMLLTLGIIIQEASFFVIQHRVADDNSQKGAEVSDQLGCLGVTETSWPILWITAYTMLVFASETTYRSLRRKHFAPRAVWVVPICIVTVVVLLIATSLPARILLATNACFGTPIWWTMNYAKLGVVLASGMLFSFLLGASIIAIQLRHIKSIEERERLEATKLFLFLLLNSVVLIGMLPYFAQTVQSRPTLQSSHVAAAFFNSSGLLNCGLFFFLRTRTWQIAGRPNKLTWPARRSNAGLERGIQISAPMLFRKDDSEAFLARATLRHDDLLYPLAAETAPGPGEPPNSLNNAFLDQALSNFDKLPIVPVVSQSSKELPPPVRLRPLPLRPRDTISVRYRVFPGQQSMNSNTNGAVPYGLRSHPFQEDLRQPEPLFARRHRRNRSGSDESSRTVIFGLRLSHTLPEVAESKNSSQLPLQIQVPSIFSEQASLFFSPLPIFAPPGQDSVRELGSWQPKAIERRASSPHWPIRKDSLAAAKHLHVVQPKRSRSLVSPLSPDYLSRDARRCPTSSVYTHHVSSVSDEYSKRSGYGWL